MSDEARDRQEIADLIHTYCLHVDGNELDLVMEVFFEDGLADYGPGGPTRGREAIGKLIAAGLANFEASHHQVSNILLQFETPDRATGVTYVTAWHRFPGDAPDGIVRGQYHDVFERREGRWGIAERRILVAGETSFPADWNRVPRR